MIANIKELECIGCTKCITACPVDAIIGAPQMMHAIINHECIGCGLCVDPCPMNCIEMLIEPEHKYDRTLAKQRVQEHKQRLSMQLQTQEQSYQKFNKNLSEKQLYILEILKNKSKS